MSAVLQADSPTTGPADIMPDVVDRTGVLEQWALDPLQTFGSLLKIAEQLSRTPRGGADSLTGEPVTNLYLAVCALDQILSDYLHRHLYEFDHLPLSRPVRRALRMASTVERGARRAWVDRVRGRLVRTERELSRLALSAARSMLDGAAIATSTEAALAAQLARATYPASLRRAQLKLPQSFRGVDLYPDDCRRLADRAFAATAGDPGPVAVIGLRTSGLYMAPICAAQLTRLGHPRVELLSLRPGAPTLPAEERSLRSLAAAGGWAFVVDDPTWRGSAIAKTVETLELTGFRPSRVWVAACEIGNQPVFRSGDRDVHGAPARDVPWSGFRDVQKVPLEKSEWRIHEHLSEEAAERFLNEPGVRRRLAATRVSVKRGHPFADTGEPPPVAGIAARPRQRRFHVQKIFEIEVQSVEGRRTELVVGRGVGLGVFGYHSYLVAHALDGFIPDLLGLQNGVLYTRWQVGPRLDSAPPSESDIDRIIGYTARRSERLKIDGDRAFAPETRAVYTGARQVARTLGRTMGGVGSVAQFRIADDLSKHLAPPHRAAIDARMGPMEWVRNSAGDLVKVDFEEHGVDITDRGVTDPLHDLAATAVALGVDSAAEARLLHGYASRTKDTHRLAARFAYHRIMAGLGLLDALTADGYNPESRRQRDDFARDLVGIERALTRSVDGYLAGLYLNGLAGSESGAVWAIDLDDTLETDWLGFQATSPAGAQALRTLASHNQLTIVSTGRSLTEVQDRCDMYGIAGGIAEYGAVVWDARHGRATPVVSPDSLRSLHQLRDALLEETDIVADPLYEHSLRLFRHTPEGRRGMQVNEVNEVIRRHGIGGVEVVEGFRKTVVWVEGTDKANALDPLLRSLGVGGRRLYAIGDEFTDLGLMRLADRAYAPANATSAVRMRAAELGISFARQARAAGVLEVVNAALHPLGGRCPECGEVLLDPADRVLTQVLGVQDRPRLARLAFALHPASIRAFET